MNAIPHPFPFDRAARPYTLIHPRVGIEDARDGLLTAAAGIAILAMLAVPAALVAAVVYAAAGTMDVARFAGMMTLLGTMLTASATTVFWMKVDERGITLGRRAGRRFVGWDEVTGIRPATRREVIVDGWLWPPVPPREATRCFSSIGHYRVDHRGGHFYYPPADAAQLLEAVDRWRALHDAERREPSAVRPSP
jgi:hypothetical protein